MLRSWPFGEADLMVAVFTREQGVVRGVARHAMRSRRRFGGALEPMTHVRATWAERPKQEVVRLDRFEIVWSPMSDAVSYDRATGLAFVAEVLEAALPDHAPDDDLFRLTLAAATCMQSGSVVLPSIYFALWVTRLLGWMPELNICAVSGEALRGQDVFYSPLRDGLVTARHRANGSTALSAEAVAMAGQVFRLSLPLVLQQQWQRAHVAELRRFAVGLLERHLEERLMSARVLAKL